MNAKEFKKEFNIICNKYDCKKSPRHDFEIQTVLGLWEFSARYLPRIKVASLHSIFMGKEYTDEKFKKYISECRVPSAYCKKWNHYSEDPQYILGFIDETLDNFKYLNK